jgi:flagellin-like hook-associated protein FlgL
LIDGLKANDIERIRGSLDGLKKSTDQLSTGRTELAGKQQEVARALETAATTGIEKKDAVSKIEEADAVKVFSDLARDQTVLRAAMDTSHKILTETSVDVLFK